MRFRIHRASDDFGKSPPVEGAERGATEFGTTEWFIEVPDLPSLMALRDSASASLIVDRGSIWVYDDYM